MSYYSRRLLPFAIIGVLVFLIFYYAIQVFFLYIESQKPKQILIEDEFGKIKRPIVKNAFTGTNFTYTLDTVEGQPITATDSAQVFFFPPSTARFGFRDKIYVVAKTLGFNTELTKHTLDGTQAIFTEPNQRLSIDITNFNFTYEYEIAQDEDVLKNTTIPRPEDIEEKAMDFLRTISRYPEELAKGKLNIIYHVYDRENNRLTSTSRPQDANVVEVDFYRPDIEAQPQSIAVVAPKYFNSQNYVIMVFGENGFKVLKAQVQFFEKSDGTVGIYPLKTGDQAYEALRAGKGIVVSRAENAPTNITIKKMFLGYYDPDTYQEYLQPIYVFLGEHEFVGYVPAVRDDYVIE
ncbi:hypothetical protein HY358_00815 [Candidatus Roizmanbacteria bacterium]|nr:hypothetical protein [Candidatus Roizmanbacteria bacterium]